MIENYYIASILKHKMEVLSILEFDFPLKNISISRIVSFIENNNDLNDLWPKYILCDLNEFFHFVLNMRKKSLEEWKELFVTLPYTDEYMILLGKFLETHTESENFWMKKAIANHLNEVSFYDAIFREYLQMHQNQEDSSHKSI